MSPRNIAWTLRKLFGFLWSLEKQKGRNKGHGLFVCLSKNNWNNPQHLAQMCAYACIVCAIFMFVWHVTTQNFKIMNAIIQRDKRCGNAKCNCVKCRICLQRILFMTDLIHVQWKSKNEWVPDFWNERQKTYVTKRNDTSVKMFLTEIKVWLTCEFFFVLTNSCLKVPSTQVTLFPCVQNLTKVKIKLFLNKLFHILYFVINIS